MEAFRHTKARVQFHDREIRQMRTEIKVLRSTIQDLEERVDDLESQH